MSFLLIWDIDGTLIQGRGIGRRAMENAFFKLYGIEEALKNAEMAGMLDSIILKNAFKLHALDNKPINQFLTEYYEFLNMEISGLNHDIAAPGIISLLETLEQDPRVFSALGTGNIEMGARIKLSKHNMNRFFPVGGFSDEEAERWEVIEKARFESKRFYNIDFKKENTFVIGDTPKDVECGKYLGLRTIAVATGPHNCNQLHDCYADYVFENLVNTNEFLDIFNSKRKD